MMMPMTALLSLRLLNNMTPIATDGRLSLLWRTILLLSLCVIVTQIFLYVWIQRSVNEHFEQMDAEILTHAAFNLRQYMDSNSIVDTSNTKKKPLSQQTLALQNRSEERRVGKERRYFMLQYQQKKNRMLLQYSR